MATKNKSELTELEKIAALEAEIEAELEREFHERVNPIVAAMRAHFRFAQKSGRGLTEMMEAGAKLSEYDSSTEDVEEITDLCENFIAAILGEDKAKKVFEDLETRSEVIGIISLFNQSAEAKKA